MAEEQVERRRAEIHAASCAVCLCCRCNGNAEISLLDCLDRFSYFALVGLCSIRYKPRFPRLLLPADDADITMRAFVLEALRSKGLSVTEEDLQDLRKRGV